MAKIIQGVDILDSYTLGGDITFAKPVKAPQLINDTGENLIRQSGPNNTAVVIGNKSALPYLYSSTNQAYLENASGNQYKLYHAGDKPTWQDLNVLSLTGGTVSGDVHVNGEIQAGPTAHKALVLTNAYDAVFGFNTTGGYVPTSYISVGTGKLTYTNAGTTTDILHSGIAAPTKYMTIAAPAGVQADLYYPVSFSNIRSEGTRIAISTTSATAASAYNNCSFNGVVKSGGWSDLGTHATGDFRIYDTNERSIHSLWSGTQNAGIIVVYVKGGAFPVNVSVPYDITVTAHATNYTHNTSVYNAGVAEPSGTNAFKVLEPKWNGFHSSHGMTSSEVRTTGNGTIGGTLAVTGAITAGGGVIGNISTATTLQTARSINGTSFNGSADITTANWGTARTLTVGNTGKSVNGSANVSWSLAEIGALPLTGGTLSGALNANGGINTSAISCTTVGATGLLTANGGIEINTDAVLQWARNTDFARIGFKNTGDADTDSYMYFDAGDNGNEYFKFRSQGVGGITDWMNIRSNGVDVKDRLYINGKTALTGTDSWLRMNGDNSFTSGTYSPYLIRSDSALQVGGNGSAFHATSAGNVSLSGQLTANTFTVSGGSVNGWLDFAGYQGDMPRLLIGGNNSPHTGYNRIYTSANLHLDSTSGNGIYLNHNNSGGFVNMMDGKFTFASNGNVTIGNDMICSYAYANGAQPQVGNALTRKDYVDGKYDSGANFKWNRRLGSGEDWNWTAGNGSWEWIPGVANVPAGSYGHGFTFGQGAFQDGTWCSQIAFGHGAGLYHRAIVNGGFGGWQKFVFQGDDASFGSITARANIDTSGIFHTTAGLAGWDNSFNGNRGSSGAYSVANMVINGDQFVPIVSAKASTNQFGYGMNFKVGIRQYGNQTGWDNKALGILVQSYENNAHPNACFTFNSSGRFDAPGHIQGTSVNGSDHISGGRVATGWDSGVAGSVSCSNWFRAEGDTGLYFASYGGGWRMVDSTWIRSYGGKKVHIDNNGNGALNIVGNIEVATHNGAGSMLRLGSSVDGQPGRSDASTITSTPNLHLDARNGYAIYLNHYSGNRVNFGNGADGVVAYVDNAGLFYTNGNGNFNDVYIRSDARLKSGFKPIESALDKVDTLTGCTFDKKMGVDPEADAPVTREAGLIAQEVQQVLPEAVKAMDNEDGILTISNAAVIGLLVEAIKELRAEVNTLKKGAGQ